MAGVDGIDVVCAIVERPSLSKVAVTFGVFRRKVPVVPIIHGVVELFGNVVQEVVDASSSRFGEMIEIDTACSLGRYWSPSL